jgi:hypothetical protein
MHPAVSLTSAMFTGTEVNGDLGQGNISRSIPLACRPDGGCVTWLMTSAARDLGNGPSV